MKLPQLLLNLGNPDLIDRYDETLISEIDGIGLFRLEFLIATEIINHPAALLRDGKGEKYIQQIVDGISKVAQKIYPKPMVVRFSDFKTNEYRGLLGGEEFENHEDNPMMGYRGASRYLSDKFNDIFRAEIQAIQKAQDQGGCDNIWPMIPFIRTVDEARGCLEIMEDEGLKRTSTCKVWLMVETPAVALQIDHFNRLSIDGYSIGSNDLIQFLLAVDRDNSELHMSGYYNDADPAVTETICKIIRSAHQGGKTCSFCGDSISNSLDMLTIVVKANIDSISINKDSFYHVKKHLASLG